MSHQNTKPSLEIHTNFSELEHLKTEHLDADSVSAWNENDFQLVNDLVGSLGPVDKFAHPQSNGDYMNEAEVTV